VVCMGAGVGWSHWDSGTCIHGRYMKDALPDSMGAFQLQLPSIDIWEFQSIPLK
jgi:hypothetical protein